MSSVRSRIGINLGAHVFRQGVGVIAGLAVVPVFLYRWPSEYYGEWLVLFSLASILNFSDAGLGTSASNDAAKHVLLGNWREAQRVISVNWTIQLFLLAVVACSCSFTVLVLNPAEILNLRHSSPVEVRWIAVLLIMYILCAVPSAIIQGLYRASERNARGIIALTCVRLVAVVVTVGALLIDCRAVGLGAWLLVTQLIAIYLVVCDVNRFSRLRLRVTAVTGGEIKQALPKALGFQVYPIAEALVTQGSIIAINQALGAAAVAVFATVRSLSRLSVQASLAIKYASWPELARLYYAANARDSVRKVLKSLSLLNVIIVSVICIATFTFSEAILAFWTGSKIHSDGALMIWLLVAAGFSAIASVPAGLLQATNQHRSIAAATLVCSVLLVASAPWCLHFGLDGIAVALIVAEAAVFVVVLQSVAREFGSSTVRKQQLPT